MLHIVQLFAKLYSDSIKSWYVASRAYFCFLLLDLPNQMHAHAFLISTAFKFSNVRQLKLFTMLLTSSPVSSQTDRQVD